MPLFRRVARRGFSNYPFKKEYVTVSVGRLNDVFADSELVTFEVLVEKKVVRKNDQYVKILADGEIDKKLTLKGLRVSAAARTKIETAGGTVEEAEG